MDLRDRKLSGKAVAVLGEAVVAQVYDKAIVATGLLANPLKEAQELGREVRSVLPAQVGKARVRVNVVGRREGQANADLALLSG